MQPFAKVAEISHWRHPAHDQRRFVPVTSHPCIMLIQSVTRGPIITKEDSSLSPLIHASCSSNQSHEGTEFHNPPRLFGHRNWGQAKHPSFLYLHHPLRTAIPPPHPTPPPRTLAVMAANHKLFGSSVWSAKGDTFNLVDAVKSPEAAHMTS